MTLEALTAPRAGVVIPSGPDTKQGHTFVYVNIPLLAVSIVVVAFRVWWRVIKKGGPLNRADICVLICTVFNTIQVACISVAILKWGFGHHASYLSAEQRYQSLLHFFVFQCFVKITVGITKLSFLFLYLDIFPQRSFCFICWALIVQISLGLVALGLTTIFQCTPVQYSWNKAISGGTCINIKAFWYGQSGWNTLMDIVVLILPIPVVLKLQMNRRAKLALLAVFVLGTFVCITSIERLISLNFNATFAKDFTWATGTSVIWTQVESTVAVICACAPSLRIPLARFIPFLFGSTKPVDSYPLGDGVSNGAGPRSGNWIDQPSRSKEYSEHEIEGDDLATTYKSEGSEERIMGIKKTVSVDLTYLERPGEESVDGSKKYEKHRFDRHVV